jgi:hypothetical protein
VSPAFEHRPFRRVPRSRTEAVLKAAVLVAATLVLLLLAAAVVVSLTNLPGWS